MDQLEAYINKFVTRFPVQYRDDLIQECWLKAWPLLPKFDPEQSKLSTYLHKYLHGACMHWLNNNVNKHKHNELVENYEVIDPETVNFS